MRKLIGMIVVGILLATAFSGCFGEKPEIPAQKEITVEKGEIKEDGNVSEQPIVVIENGEKEAEERTEYKNIKKKAAPAIFSISKEYFGAVCLIPAFIGSNSAVPLLLDDGTDPREIKPSFEKMPLSDFGNDAASISVGIAKKYWERMDVVISVENYEQALWLAPVACHLSAPIIVNPTQSVLSDIGAKFLICAGESQMNIEKKILRTREDVWKFQMEVSKTKPNYFVVTNPDDVFDSEYAGLSLASAALSGFRNAVVLTGDYSGDKTKIEWCANEGEDAEEYYEEVRGYGEKIETDIQNAIKFFGYKPEYMALVGGPFSLPSYYVNPGYYLASLTPYFNSEDYDEEGYVDEDIAGGRIVGDCVLDITYQLMRTFCYREFLPNGKYYSSTQSGWERKSLVVDGTDPKVGTCEDALEMAMLFNDAGFENEYLLFGLGTADAIDDKIDERNMVYASCHGSHDGWYGMATQIVGAEDIRKLELSPSLVWSYCCLSSALDGGLNVNEYISLAFVHSGALSYISHTEVSAGYLPVVADIVPGMNAAARLAAKYAFNSILFEDATVGKALATAKNRAQSEFPDDRDMLSLQIYGDPAWNPYVPGEPTL